MHLRLCVYLYYLYYFLCSQPSQSKHCLPTTFLGRKSIAAQKQKMGKVVKEVTYNRDIICLPMRYLPKSLKSNVKIPKDRSELSRCGLIGKITLSSNMTQEEIFNEIRSVFRTAMGENKEFSFDVLQLTGGKSKDLTVPALSPSYNWTASSIVPKSAKVPLYIIAREPLIKVIMLIS